MPGVDMKDVRALQLDHRNNDGAEERRLYGRQSYSIMTYMKLTGDPEVRKKFQVLCANCNIIKYLDHLLAVKK